MRRSSARARWTALTAAVLLWLSALDASAEGSQGRGGTPGARKDWPCPACVTIAPSKYTPTNAAPLFVALHGDEGSTRVILKTWKAPLERRGYLLLALRFPKEKGCNASYWQWAGDPAWILAQVDALEAAYNVDRSRIYLSGWSGGATYIGMSASALSPRFAALNLNAGGAPPRDRRTCAPCKAPVYYFMGGRNPLLHLAEATRDHFRGCAHDLVWDFEPRLDHAGELAALSGGMVPERVLAWLETKQNVCAAGTAGAPAGGEGGRAPSPANSLENKSNTTDYALAGGGAGDVLRPTKPQATPGGCGCRPTSTARAVRASDHGSPPASLPAAAGVVGLSAALARRRRRNRALPTSPLPRECMKVVRARQHSVSRVVRPAASMPPRD